MKMRRISETGALGRLEEFYLKRVEALVNVLQQKLDYFSPQSIGGDPAEEMPTSLATESFEGAGDFLVSPIPTNDPSVSLAYVTDDQGNEALVDTVIATSYLSQLPQATTTNEQIWEALNAAASETDTSSMKSLEQVSDPGEQLWQQQFIASRCRPSAR